MKCIIKYKDTKETATFPLCMICKKPIGVEKGRKYIMIIKIAEKYPSFCDRCSEKVRKVR